MEKPEYNQWRCCMCPQKMDTSTACPAGTPCRFVKTYKDKRGWLYRVMSGIGEGRFKARYKKPSKNGWKCYPGLPWRETFDKAQGDLNIYASKKSWEEVDHE